MLRNYSFRNLFKERMCQVHDALDYPRHHPYTAIQQQAYETTTEFVIETCSNAIACRSPQALMQLALRRVSIEGEYLEFGVWKGASIKFIAKRFPEKIIHGFDSFEGLPESWVHNDVGSFSLGGKSPKVPRNVVLHKGWFEDTLPIWVARNKNNVALLHVDCDLRSATQTIFNYLAGSIVSGTVIIFDDYFNFQNWENDGHAVFTEYLKNSNHTAKNLGYAFKELAIVIE